MSLLSFFSRKITRMALIATTLGVVGTSTTNAAEKNSFSKKTTLKQTLKRSAVPIKRSKNSKDNFVLKELLKRVKGWEGVVAHPYLDRGCLAVGAGCRIHSYDEFKEFDFKKENGKSLTEEERKNFYIKCLSFQKKAGRTLDNYKASYFKSFMPYCATQKSIDDVLQKRLLRAMESIKKKVGYKAYYRLRPEAQIAIIDMEYNLGRNKFIDKKGCYPNFFAAVRKLDYDSMRRESVRNGVSDTRNKDIGNLFMQAKQKRFVLVKHFGKNKV